MFGASVPMTMINIPAGTRMLLATRPIDFRKGAHSLAGLAQEVLAEDPFSGVVSRLSRETVRSGEDPAVGRQRPGAGLEAVAAGIVSPGHRSWMG